MIKSCDSPIVEPLCLTGDALRQESIHLSGRKPILFQCTKKKKKTENKKRKSQSKILQDGHGTVKKAKCRTSKGKVATATKKDGKLALQKNHKIKFVSDSEAQEII